MTCFNLHFQILGKINSFSYVYQSFLFLSLITGSHLLPIFSFEILQLSRIFYRLQIPTYCVSSSLFFSSLWEYLMESDMQKFLISAQSKLLLLSSVPCFYPCLNLLKYELNDYSILGNILGQKVDVSPWSCGVHIIVGDSKNKM